MAKLSDARFKQNYASHLKHLKLKGLQPKTIDAYSRAIRRVGEHFNYQIDSLTEPQLTDFFSKLVVKGSWSTVKIDLYGLKVYYEHVLRKPWVAPGLIKPPKSQRLPDIITIGEGGRIFAAPHILSYRVLFLTLYSLGLRLGEGLRQQVGDIETVRAQVATSKGVIQGYSAQAAADSAHHVIVAADVIGSGSEQSMLLPMIEKTAPYREAHTLITADAGYHSEDNVDKLKRQEIPALIADNQMRKRDERLNDQSKHRAKKDSLYDKRAAGQTKVIKRFAPQDFKFRGDNTATCSAGKTLKSTGTRHTTAAGLRYQLYAADATDCQTCTLRSKCLRRPGSERGRQVTRFEPKAINPSDPSERTKRAIDLERGRRLYSQRMGTVEPMFGTLRHNKQLTRLNLHGRKKVNAQWHLYCMVHNIEKLANSGWAP